MGENIKVNVCLGAQPFPYWQGHFMAKCESRPKKCSSTNKHATIKDKERTAVNPGYMDYLSKFSPAVVEIYEPLWKLTLVKIYWTGNRM